MATSAWAKSAKMRQSPCFVGVCQGGARDLGAGAHVAELALLGAPAGFDVASTLAVGQLREGDKEILLETGDARDPVIAGVAANATAKGVHQKMVDELGKTSLSRYLSGLQANRGSVQLTDKRVQSMTGQISEKMFKGKPLSDNLAKLTGHHRYQTPNHHGAEGPGDRGSAHHG
jgi:hypothetical protein